MSKKVDRVPLLSPLSVTCLSFFLNTLPNSSFLRIYGPQICIVYRSEDADDALHEEISFYYALRNLNLTGKGSALLHYYFFYQAIKVYANTYFWLLKLCIAHLTAHPCIKNIAYLIFCTCVLKLVSLEETTDSRLLFSFLSTHRKGRKLGYGCRICECYFPHAVGGLGVQS
jgi:hypothetical protein